MKIIHMKKKHIPQVIDILSDAFNASALERKGKKRDRKRNAKTISPYLEIEPKGCFVALDKTKVIGAIFAHTWGKYGWIGTFGVKPDSQSKGIGKLLMQKAINYLDVENNVNSLALETMADSKKNIGLYSKLGFRPALLTMSMIRPIIDSPFKEQELQEFAEKNSLNIRYYSEESNTNEILLRCNWLSNKIINGLEHSKDIEAVKDHSLGETILLLKNDFIIGYAIISTASRYERAEKDKDLSIKVMVIDKDLKDSQYLDYLIYTCEKFGINSEKRNLKLRVNSSYWLVYKYLIDNGFAVRSAILRMIKFGDEIKSFDSYHDWIVYCTSLTM